MENPLSFRIQFCKSNYNPNIVNKRTFLKQSLMMSFTAPLALSGIDSLWQQTANWDSQTLAKAEDFWKQIRKAYEIKPDYINLENGYYCFIPEPTLEAYIRHIREVNYQGAFYMRTVRESNKARVAAKLAELAGCSADELVVTRNTTESLDTIIAGFPWQEGDEAVMAEQDYFSMLTMFQQVSKRFNMVCHRVNVPLHPQSDEEIVSVYEKAITPKTKLLMVCHMVNITGQILPIKKICDMAHSKGVQVLVDGAHAFAHIQFSIPELNCDYYGASLHKWLSVPLGAGLLYVKKEHIPTIWPLMAPGEKQTTDITRLNHTGTNPVAVDLAIENAIEFHKRIGAERKEARLRFLQEYWTSKVRNVSNVIINTPPQSERACAIANVGIKNMKPALLAERLLKEFKIYTVAIDGAGVQGVRVTPNVYTTTDELDVLVKAIQTLAKTT
ncbi:MAG: aminotransferase class V-fold PLP-dependent enzyme [Chryseotalea sp.]